MNSVACTPRRTTARSAGVLVAIAAALVTACSGDSVTQPNLTARNGGLLLTDASTALVSVEALARDTAIAIGVTHSFSFGKRGGTIDMRDETGLRIDIPENAIPGNSLTIVVTALPGKAVAYDFQPHGTVFLKPLTFRHDLKNTSWDKLRVKGTLNGGYFKDASQIDLTNGIARLDELFPVTLKSSEVSFSIKHFSGYMVSGGRSSVSSNHSDF